MKLKKIIIFLLIIIICVFFHNLLFNPLYNAENDEKRLLVLFIADFSESISRYFDYKNQVRKLHIELEMIQENLIKNIDSQIGLITFGEKPIGICKNYKMAIKPDFNTYFQIFQYLEKANPVGSSPMIPSYMYAFSIAKQYIGKSKIIIFTDGIGACYDKITDKKKYTSDNCQVSIFLISPSNRDKGLLEKYFDFAEPHIIYLNK